MSGATKRGRGLRRGPSACPLHIRRDDLLGQGSLRRALASAGPARHDSETMEDPEQISALIGDIYDAALDPALWRGVLGAAARFVGGSAAALYWKDAAARSAGVYYDDGGIDPYYRQLYFDKYIKLDPATSGHFFAELEQPVATNDLIRYEEFLETRFYKEWVRPQGLVDFITATLDKSTTSAVMFGVFRHQRDGVVDEDTRQRMRLIVPHVRRAALVAKTIDLKTAEAATFTNTLDGLTAGMFLVDGRGRIVHANAAGDVLLAAGDVLRMVGNRLSATDAQANRALADILRSAEDGDAGIGVRGIALPLFARDRERHVAHVMPMTSGARRRTGATYAAVAAVFVHKAAIDTPSLPETIAKTYGLTPTELRVLLAIVEVGGVPEVAEALGVADTTVKTHLGRLYEKTGVGRQADLVKLVAGFSHPLLN